MPEPTYVVVKLYTCVEAVHVCWSCTRVLKLYTCVEVTHVCWSCTWVLEVEFGTCDVTTFYAGNSRGSPTCFVSFVFVGSEDMRCVWVCVCVKMHDLITTSSILILNHCKRAWEIRERKQEYTMVMLEWEGGGRVIT